MDDAEKELRAIYVANPTDVEAELNVVRFLQQFKGPSVAREELVSRIAAGGQVFPFQMALAGFYFAQGKVTETISLLEKLASSSSSRDDAIAAQVKLAQVQLSRRNFEKAEALVSEILRKDDHNTDGLKLRASIRMERGQLDAAVADLRQALNDQPRSSELMLLLASAYERSGSIELAEKQYADATKTSGFDVVVGLNYSTFLQRRGNIERSEDVLTELANRWPNDVRVLSALAQTRLARQNWSGAQEIADKIRRIGDNRGLADEILGVALIGRNRLDDSIGILQKVYGTTPGTQPMAALVGTLVRAQKVDQATAFLNTVLRASPENAEAHVLLGSIQLLQNAPDQALKSFRTAIEQQPKNVAGYQALAQYYVRNKDLKAAEDIIRTALHERPDSADMHLALANVFELKGDNEAAISEYESMLKEQSGSLIVANNLASLLADYRTDKASLDRAYSLAVSLRKSPLPPFKDTLGWIYYLRGEYNNAIPLLEDAVAALSDRPLVRYHLAMSYIATGQLAKASEQLKKARESTALNADLEAKIKAAEKKAAI